MNETILRPKYIKDSANLNEIIKLGFTTESTFLDFKLDVNLSSASPKKKQESAEELALDICQFANSWGGVLLIGVKEAECEKHHKKIALEFSGILNFEQLTRFINDSVLPLIHPREIAIDIECLNVLGNKQIVAINVYPIASGVACVCNISSPFSQKFPYRTHYGKKYLQPMEVEKRMVANNRGILIKLNEFSSLTREITLFPKIIKDPIDPDKWDNAGLTIQLMDFTSSEFSLKIGGVTINLPYSLVRDVWFTENRMIGMLLHTRLIMTSDRKNIYLDL